MSEFRSAIDYFVDRLHVFPNLNTHYATVCHGTGDSASQTVEQLGNYFRTNSLITSVHYGIGRDGRIAQYVLESDGAGGNRGLLYGALFPEPLVIIIYALFAKAVKSIFLSPLSWKKIRCSRFKMQALGTLLQRGILGYSVHTLDLLNLASRPGMLAHRRGKNMFKFTSSVYHETTSKAILCPFLLVKERYYYV